MKNKYFILHTIFIILYAYTVTAKLNIFSIALFLLLILAVPWVGIYTGKLFWNSVGYIWGMFFGWHLIRFLIIPLLGGVSQFGDEMISIFVSFIVGFIGAVIICAPAYAIKYARPDEPNNKNTENDSAEIEEEIQASN